MPPFRWEEVDHTLAMLRLTDLAEEMHSQIKADENRIQFENRSNMNSNTVPSLVLEMKLARADEWARRAYEIYCDVWQKQGNIKSAAFLRAVYPRGILPVLRGRANAIVGEFARFATATNFPGTIRDAHMKSFQLKMLRLESRWQRRLEAEAKECEHAEKTAGLSRQIVQSGDLATKETLTRIPTEPNYHPAAGGSRQPVGLSPRVPNRRKPGRSPRLPPDFVVCAGAQWRAAISDSHTKVTDDQLRQIAFALDAADHLPPTRYLEGKCAEELKDFNRRNSNSKIGAVKTWSQLVSRGDKDLLRGMRRLFSRCAKKLHYAHPLSGN